MMPFNEMKNAVEKTSVTFRQKSQWTKSRTERIDGPGLFRTLQGFSPGERTCSCAQNVPDLSLLKWETDALIKQTHIRTGISREMSRFSAHFSSRGIYTKGLDQGHVHNSVTVYMCVRARAVPWHCCQSDVWHTLGAD